MVSERVVEIPWALGQLPQTGVILDVGSCEATYLRSIPQPDRPLHCLDARICVNEMPPEATFHHQNLIGNTLPRAFYDAVLLLSTLEHIGLPYYEQKPFRWGDRLALAEVRELLTSDGVAIVTVPAGQSKITSWYRQYSPEDLRELFWDWEVKIRYWGYDGKGYVPIEEGGVTRYDYRDRPGATLGAGALAGILARPLAT